MRKNRTMLPLLAALAGAAPAQDDRPERRVADPALQKQINDAIARGVEYLVRAQAADGTWVYDHAPAGRVAADPPPIDGTGGLTGLALYALAASGVPADHDAIVRGLAWTEQHDEPFDGGRYGTYSAALLTLALTRIDADAQRRRIHTLATRLVEAQLRTGMWTYSLDYNRTGGGTALGRVRVQEERAAPGDNSNAQLAVLALWAAQSLARFKVPRRTWERVQALYERTQQSDGGWTYKDPDGLPRDQPAPATTPTMTVAGLVGWVCAAASLKGGVKGLPKAREHDVATRGREAFLAAPRRYTNYYFVYGIERAATMLDLPSEAWYPDGAKALVRQQRDDGRWAPPPPRDGRPQTGHGDQANVYETALALLFLSRATAHPITPGPTRPAGGRNGERTGDGTGTGTDRDGVQPGQGGTDRDR